MTRNIRIPTLKGIKFTKYSGIERALKDDKEVNFGAGTGGPRVICIYTPGNRYGRDSQFVVSYTNITSAIKQASDAYLTKHHNLFFRWGQMSQKDVLDHFKSEKPNLRFENDSDEWIMRGHDIFAKRKDNGLVCLKYTWRLNYPQYDFKKGDWGPIRYHEPLAVIKTRSLKEGLSQFEINGIDDSKAPFRRDLPLYYLTGSIINKVFPELDIKNKEILASQN